MLSAVGSETIRNGQPSTQLNDLINETNPVLATYSVLSNDESYSPSQQSVFGMNAYLRIQAASRTGADNRWISTCMIQLLITTGLLLIATQGVYKTFPVRHPFRRRRFLVFSTGKLQWVGEEELHHLAEEHIQEKAAEGRAPLKRARLIESIQCGNPVLQRELRNMLQWRLWPSALIGIAFVVGIIMIPTYLGFFWLAFDHFFYESIWQLLAFGTLLFIIVGCALAGAYSIARERESATWETLTATRLSPLEIVQGKISPPLMGSCLMILCGAPIAFACIFPDHNLPAFTDTISSIPADEGVIALLVMLTTAYFTTCWALLVSWYCRRVIAAVSWTVMSLFTLWAVAPRLFAVTGTDSTFLPLSANPFLALQIQAAGRNHNGAWLEATTFSTYQIAMLFGLGCMALIVLIVKLYQEMRI